MRTRFFFLLRFYGVLLVVFFLAKAGFVLCDAPAGTGVSLADFLALWWHGLPLDLATAGYLTALPWLAVALSAWVRIPRLRLGYSVYSAIVAAVLAVIFVADTCLYAFWDVKLDGTVFNYLDSPRGVAASVSAGYLFGAVVAIVLVGLALFFALVRLFPRELPPVRRRLAATCAAVVVGGLLFLGIRGGVGKSTANVGMVYFSDVQFLNHAAVNPAFSLVSSALKTKDYAQLHDYFPEAERARIFATLGYGTRSVAPDTLLRVRRPNVLLILMEGCGGTFVHAVDSLADPSVTPRLNGLAAEGVVFTQCYANSFRTDRGTVCALSGYPAFPDVSVMKLPSKCAHLPSIARSLAQAGYATDFLYGGDINFTNTNGYLLSTGYGRTAGDTSFPPELRRTHDWGVTDRFVFDRLLEELAGRSGAQPWHTAVLTLASHEPWGVPYARIKGDTVANAMAYLDDCIGRFVDRFRETPQWANTLVVILPDHGIGYPEGIAAGDPRRAHIPMIWTGGAVRGHRVVDLLCNQTDLPATLLGQLGLPHDDFRFSRDVLSRTYTRPSAVHVWSEGIWYMDSTGYTSLNLLSKPQRVLEERPAPSAGRAAAANALLQTAYDDLGGL